MARAFVTTLAGFAVAVAPVAATLLAAPSAVRPASQVDSRVETPLPVRYAANRAAMHAAGMPFEGQFLVFDPHGDGRIAQVFGDLATADRIAVLVPGAGNRAANFHRGVGGKRFRSPAVQAGDLFAEARRYGPVADRFAAVAWLGYDAPDRLDVTAAREDLALAGAVALERFVADLVALRPHATVALLGHSYGSTVIGLAAHRLPKQVTDLAVFGSPGLGVDGASQLGTTARVWAGLSARDVMRRMPGIRLVGLGHGAQPADPEFGGRIFATDDVADHDGYLKPGTDSLAALTGIAVTGGVEP
jgi:pimeloyl-ACP methyl ester carboxylesterase